MTKNSSADGPVIRGTRAEGEQLRQFNTVAHFWKLVSLGSWSYAICVRTESVVSRYPSATLGGVLVRHGCDIRASGWQTAQHLCIWQKQCDGHQTKWTKKCLDDRRQNCTRRGNRMDGQTYV